MVLYILYQYYIIKYIMFIVRDTTIVNKIIIIIIMIYYNSFPPQVCIIMSFVLYSCKRWNMNLET